MGRRAAGGRHHVGRGHRVKGRRAAPVDALALITEAARKHIKPYLLGVPLAVRRVYSSCTPASELPKAPKRARDPKMSASLKAVWARRKAQTSAPAPAPLAEIPAAKTLVSRSRRGR